MAEHVASQILFPLSSLVAAMFVPESEALSLQLQEVAWQSFEREMSGLCSDGQLTSGHLCEAPGGFVRRTKKWADSLKLDHRWWTAGRMDAQGFPADLTCSGKVVAKGDLEQSLAKILAKAPKHTLFMTTDHSCKTEAELLPLLQTQVEIVQNVLGTGGMCVFRFLDIALPETLTILARLNLGFRSVELVKSVQSSPLDFEKFVVCRGKRSNEEILANNRRRVQLMLPEEPLRPELRNEFEKSRVEAQTQIARVTRQLAGLDEEELDGVLRKFRSDRSFKFTVSAFLSRVLGDQA